VKRLLLSALLSNLLLAAFAQNPMQDIRARFAARDYPSGNSLAWMYYESDTSSLLEKVTLQIWIAAAECLSDKTEVGTKRLNWLLSNYRFGQEDKSRIVGIMRNCNQASTETVFAERSTAEGGPQPLLLVINTPTVRAGSAGKGGRAVYSLEPNVVKLQPVELLQIDLPDKVALHASNSAIHAQYSGVYADLYPHQVYSTDRISVVATAAVPQLQLRAVANYLTGLQQNYAERYGYRQPPYRTVVHLVNTENEFPAIAERGLGQRVPKGVIGLSDTQTNSIVMALYIDYVDPQYCGTVQHELMHLLINYNNPFLPPWLSEGLPSLHEVTTQNGMTGMPNWRGQILREVYRQNAEALLPNMKELITADWSNFHGYSSQADGDYVDLSQQALNYAYNRYFLLFLQGNELLLPVFQAFSNNQPGRDGALQTPEELILASTGKNIEELDQAFRAVLEQFLRSGNTNENIIKMRKN